MNPLSHRAGLTAAAIAASIALAACGSSSSSSGSTTTAAKTTTSTTAATTAPASSAAVTIHNYMYTPMHLVVKAGAKVTFTNKDQTAHTATSNNGSSFDTGPIQPGKSATITLTKAGVYPYHCSFHAFMMATITVVK